METQMHSEERNELLLVVDVMTTKLVALRPEQTCAHAVELLTQHSFRHFPVLNGDRTVAGVISDRDILWAMAEAAKWQTKPISSIMTRKIISASPETPVSVAAEVMIAGRVNCLPVLDSSALAVGIVTSTDLLKLHCRRPRPIDPAIAL
jgi:acetoin utilization protein AcuB